VSQKSLNDEERGGNASSCLNVAIYGPGVCSAARETLGRPRGGEGRGHIV